MQPSVLAKVLILTAFSAWVVSIFLMPIVRWAACKVGLVDRPDPTRKLHRGEIALGGGIGVFLTLLVTAFLVDRFYLPAHGVEGLELSSRWLCLIGASLAILLLGVIDDRFALRGKQKLLGQAMIVIALAWVWQPDNKIALFGTTFDLGLFAFPLLVVWLLATINAVNLIDGADGAASSFGIVAAMGIALCAFVCGQATVAIAAAALGASLAGFLCFNRPPASIFLGDAGSMLLGLVLGVLACWSVERPNHSQDVLIPVALLGVPLFDSIVAILRRVLTGRSIYMPDRGHLHHILQSHFKARTLSPMWMIIAFGGLSLVTTAGAVVGAVFKSDVSAVVAISMLTFGLVWSRLFGHAEARLLASHTKRVGGSIVSKVWRGQPKTHVSGVPLQGNREWDSVWMPLTEFAEKNGLWRLKLDLNMPWKHEGYHGLWARGEMPEKAEQWSVRLPIFCEQRSIGRIEIVGHCVGTNQIESLESFSYLISELQPEIERLVHCLSPVHESHPAPRRPSFIEVADEDPSGRLQVAAR